MANSLFYIDPTGELPIPVWLLAQFGFAAYEFVNCYEDCERDLGPICSSSGLSVHEICIPACLVEAGIDLLKARKAFKATEKILERVRAAKKKKKEKLERAGKAGKKSRRLKQKKKKRGG